MSAVLAPGQLPLAPRPLPTELISSCLLRVAAANSISLEELLEGFKSRNPGCLAHGQLLDCSLPQATLTALEFFCHLPFMELQRLDLAQQAPHLDVALLLRFRNVPPLCPRRQRLRYAFCPLCIAAQPLIHIPWDWCVACLVHCPIHGLLLREGCPACGELDPLHFTPPDQPLSRVCWSCGADLTECHDATDATPGHLSIQAVEDAYRAALLGIGPDPSLLGKATNQSFRSFVHDLLRILTLTLRPRSFEPNVRGSSTTLLARKDLLQIIAELVLNAAPTSDIQRRRSRCARGRVLWTALLRVIPEHEAAEIERASQKWPLALRRRFVSALYHSKRRRWPCSPFEGHALSLRFKCSGLSEVFDLTTAKALPGRKSRI